MSNITVSFIQKGDIQESARVLSIAMLQNPLHVAVYQDSSEKSRREIERGFARLLSEIPGIGFIAKDGQEIVGVMRMRSCSGKDAVNDAPEPQSENNIAWRKMVWQDEWARNDPEYQHWHLGPIGVLPTHQGAGIGSMLMTRFCSEVDACKASGYLETDKDVNVEFYGKFGFRTVGESMILGVKNRFMLRVSQG